MVNQKYLFVRLTKNQYERIRIKAEAKGYKTISSYIRALTLDNDLGFEQKFDRMYDKVINGGSNTMEDKNDAKLTQFL